jgi:hypothetical protein
MTRRTWFGALAAFVGASTTARATPHPLNEAAVDRLFAHGVYDVDGRKVGTMRMVGVDLVKGPDGLFRSTGTHYATVNVTLASRIHILIAASAALFVAACTSSLDTPTAPDAIDVLLRPSSFTSSYAPAGNAAISCPHEPVRIVRSQGSLGSLDVAWVPLLNVDAYQVEVWYSRSGQTPHELLRTFLYDRRALGDGLVWLTLSHAIGGRYRIQVQTRTRCGTLGRAAVATAIVDGPDTNATSGQQWCGYCHK